MNGGEEYSPRISIESDADSDHSPERNSILTASSRSRRSNQVQLSRMSSKIVANSESGTSRASGGQDETDENGKVDPDLI